MATSTRLPYQFQPVRAAPASESQRRTGTTLPPLVSAAPLMATWVRKTCERGEKMVS